MKAKDKLIEHLEDNSEWMGIDHIKRVIRCVQSEKDVTHVIDIENGIQVKVTCSFVKEDAV